MLLGNRDQTDHETLCESFTLLDGQQVFLRKDFPWITRSSMQFRSEYTGSRFLKPFSLFPQSP